MPKTKISEFSATPGNNTDIDGINLAEGCAPSGINDAIRELMAQLKDFQAGTAGDSFNGPIGTTTPAAGVFTNLSASGTFALTGDQVQISEGGTGQTTANAAFNALAPSQSTHAGKYLKTDGTNTSWDALDISTADITGTLPIANGGTGLTALGTGVQTALGIAVGSAGAFVTNGGALGTPSSGTVTNLTGTASININGTVGATTPTTGAFTTLSASGNITVSGGTANGVAYLNGSKVLTTGSALSFDGTNLGLSNSAAATVVKIDGSGRYKQFETYSSGTRQFYIGWDNTSQVANITNDNNYPILFSITGSEQMRLTSTGLGIGTSSPTTKLDVVGVVRATGAGPSVISVEGSAQLYAAVQLQATSSGGKNWSLVSNATSSPLGAAGSLSFRDSSVGTTHMTLDSSGNLGLGVTPSAWSSSVASQVGYGAALSSRAAGNTASDMTHGAYWNGTNWLYQYSSVGAARYQMTGANGGSTHAWFVSAGGTAGNAISFTQAMTLDANGNLGLGTTSPRNVSGYKNIAIDGSTSGLLEINTNGTRVFSLYGAGNDINLVNPTATGTMQFYTNNTERARITSGGDLLVGKTATGLATGIQLESGGGSSFIRSSSSNADLNLYVYSTGAAAARFYVGMGGTVYATSTTITAISDQRLKENIQDIDVGLDKIMALKPRKFDWKAGKGKDKKGDRGWIAQEFEQVFPEMIDTWRDAAPEGEEPYKAVNADLIPVLVKAIQEQQAIITDLRARVAQLEAK